MFKKFKKLIKKMWVFLKNPLNLIIYIIVVILFYSPSIVGYILSAFNPWHSTYATAYWLFWLGPWTPAIPIQLAITFGIRKLIDKIIKYKRRKQNGQINNEDSEKQQSE